MANFLRVIECGEPLYINVGFIEHVYLDGGTALIYTSRFINEDTSADPPHMNATDWLAYLEKSQK